MRALIVVVATGLLLAACGGGGPSPMAEFGPPAPESTPRHAQTGTPPKIAYAVLAIT